jgi:hypothetical protein
LLFAVVVVVGFTFVRSRCTFVYVLRSVAPVRLFTRSVAGSPVCVVRLFLIVVSVLRSCGCSTRLRYVHVHVYVRYVCCVYVALDLRYWLRSLFVAFVIRWFDLRWYYVVAVVLLRCSTFTFTFSLIYVLFGSIFIVVRTGFTFGSGFVLLRCGWITVCVVRLRSFLRVVTFGSRFLRFRFVAFTL